MSDNGRIHEETADISSEAYCPSCDKSYEITLESCPVDGSSLVRFSDTPDDLIGRVIDDRFEILESLGAGGMGMVYRARQRSVDRQVAFKVIQRNRTKDRGTVKRFLREARLTSQLNHQNIVVIHDVGQDPDGFLYIAMELIEGETLSSLLAREERLDVERTRDIASQLCDALEFAHQKNIVHRDLKPSNIMLVGDSIKVLDFGIAKSLAGESTTELTDSNQILGTPAYIAPEMMRGQISDNRADLYALGCLIYKMISGRVPLPAPTISGALARHLHDQPEPLETDPVLAGLVARLLAKDPDERPGSAAQVKRELFAEPAPTAPIAPIASTAPTVPIAPSELPTNDARSRPRESRSKLIPLGLAMMLVAIIGVVVVHYLTTRTDRNTAALASAADAGAADAAEAVARQTLGDASVATPVETNETNEAATLVELQIRVSPRNAVVILPSGETLTAPKRIEVLRSAEPLILRFSARGYKSVEKTVTPSKDQRVEAKLTRKRDASRPANSEPDKPPSKTPDTPSETPEKDPKAPKPDPDKPPEIEFRVPKSK